MKPETITTAKAILSAAITDKGERDELLKALAPKPPVREKLLTTKAASALAECHPKTLFSWARKGYLTPRRITARRVRWSKNELERFLCETAEG